MVAFFGEIFREQADVLELAESVIDCWADHFGLERETKADEGN